MRQILGSLGMLDLASVLTSEDSTFLVIPGPWFSYKFVSQVAIHDESIGSGSRGDASSRTTITPPDGWRRSGFHMATS